MTKHRVKHAMYSRDSMDSRVSRDSRDSRDIRGIYDELDINDIFINDVFELGMEGNEKNDSNDSEEAEGADSVTSVTDDATDSAEDIIIVDEVDEDAVLRSRKAIERHFTKGACYQVINAAKSKKIIDSLKKSGKYKIQEINMNSNDPEQGYTFRYLGKVGIHHVFIEVCGGWKRTYTDAQLVGKELIEVSENDIRAFLKASMCADVRF